MRAHEGRLLERPSPLRPSVAAIRGLDRVPLAPDLVKFVHLPTNSSQLVAVTPPGGGALKLLVAGPSTAATYKLIVPSPFFLQFRFQPGAARAVFGVPLHELVDRIVPIEELWGRPGRELLEAVGPLEGSAGGVAKAFEGVVLRRLDRAKPAAGADLVRHAARALEKDAGGNDLRALARRLGAGERTLRQAFHEHVGVSPKRYARIARIRGVARRAGTMGWAHLVAEHGFYDQAHLNAEFRALLGVTPRDFLARRWPFAAP